MGKFSKNYRTFYPNNCQSSSKYGLGIRDPGDGTNPFRIPDPGVKKAPDPGAVLSLTVDKVISITIFISAGTCPVSGGSRAAGSNSCSADCNCSRDTAAKGAIFTTFLLGEGRRDGMIVELEGEIQGRGTACKW